MTRVNVIKLVLLLVGLFIFAYGVRTGFPEVRWAGIAIVALAFFLRLLPKDGPPDEGPGGTLP